MFKVKKIELKSNFSENALDSSQMKQVLGGFASDSSATTGAATTTTTRSACPNDAITTKTTIILPITRK